MGTPQNLLCFNALHLDACKLTRAKFNQQTRISDARFGAVEGLDTCDGLEFIQVGSEREIYLLNKSLQTTKLQWSQRHFSWERLRTFGNLPLFGVSFSALIAIPAAMFMFASYNHEVSRLQEWAAENSRSIMKMSAPVGGVGR